MTTQEVATRLVQLCRAGKFMEAHQELYSPNIVSVEPDGSEANGAAEVHAKGEEFFANNEVHGLSLPTYYVGHNSFSVAFELDVTSKDGERTTLKEIGVYTVEGGKIVHEQFQPLGE